MKKPYLYLLALLLLIGCDQAKKNELSNVPKNEAALIKQFNIINTKLLYQANEASKKEAIDSGASHISNFIKQNLKLKVEQWNAYVVNVTESVLEGAGDNVFDVNVFIPLKDSYDEEHPTTYAITLKCQVKSDDKVLMPIVKKLRPFDKVIVTGTFKSEEGEDIKFTDWSSPRVSENDFVGPEFIITLENIKKISN